MSRLKPSPRRILALWGQNPTWKPSFTEILRALGGRNSESRPLKEALEGLVSDGKLRHRNRHYGLVADKGGGGRASAEWHEIRDSAPQAIVRFGLFHDLTILERISSEEGPEVLAFNTALFDTGGPVLVTPPESRDGTIGEHVAVAWSPGPQSVRAVRSALPLLREAKTVTIVTNGANPEADPAPLATYLARNGIGTQSQSFSGAKLTARGRGRAMLAAVAETAADLLVMGAYGENRLSAIFGLGRATRKVVTAAPIPLLIQS